MRNQVRTILQHAWASISHSLDYKSTAEVPDEVKRTLFQVAALIEVGDGLFEKFRSDVDALRRSYSDTLADGGWRTLPVNHDALTASFGCLAIEDLVDVIRRQGVVVQEGGNREGMADDLASIVDISQQCGYATMGSLEEVLLSAKTRERWEQFSRILVENLRRHAEILTVQMSPEFITMLILAIAAEEYPPMRLLPNRAFVAEFYDAFVAFFADRKSEQISG